MGLLGAIGFSLALVSLIQIPHSAEGCKILSAEASGPSSILVKWDVHPGATNYFLDLRVINNTHSSPVVLNLRASITEKNVKDLQPGTKYRVNLKVFSFYYLACTTTIEASTVPATSEIVVHRALSSTSLMVKWTEVPSAINYFLVVRFQADGHVHVVHATYTNTTAVVKGLQPSSNYDCSVYTVNQAGAGSQSRVKTITTLQHPPIGVAATQTGLSTARVTWQPMDGIPMYQVIIRDIADANSQSTMYNVTDTRLDVQGILPCSTYLISVSSYNNFLVPSEPTDYTYTTNKLKAVSSVSVAYSCHTHSAMVHWTAVFVANNYKAEARGANGTLLTCTSTQTSCEITGLSCGQSYEVHVTPMSESCKQMVNTTWATFQTVPCPPQNLTLSGQCVSNVIIFSWDHTNNTDHYLARAVDNKGMTQDCLTVDNSCYFTNTYCGRLYSFTVHSRSGSCSSDISSTVDIRTAPCAPQNLQTSADCGSDVFLSKWDLAEGALRYTVEALGNRGERAIYNCSTSSNSCAIQGVPCGDFLTTYITAFDDECSSPRKLGPVAETVPCPTHSISAVKDCGADSITLTWATNGNEFFFVAMARDINGLIHSSNSFSRSSQIKGLRCGTNYTVYVISSNFVCNSTESEMVTIETAACPPNNITSALDSENNEALISWDGHMNSYTATMVDEEAGLLSCSSTNTSCRIPNLKCGQNYTVTVRYHDGICPGLRSEASYIDSGACCPSGVRLYQSAGNSVLVHWRGSGGDHHHYITEMSGSSNNYTCTAPPGESSCNLTNIQCGEDYRVVVAPLTPEGSQVPFCPQRQYKVTCSGAGSNIGTVMYRGRRSVD